jgi:hypothetical protein
MSPQLKISILWVDRQPDSIVQRRRRKQGGDGACALAENTTTKQQTTNNKQQHTQQPIKTDHQLAIVYVLPQVPLFSSSPSFQLPTQWFNGPNARNSPGKASAGAGTKDSENTEDEDAISKPQALHESPQSPKRD